MINDYPKIEDCHDLIFKNKDYPIKSGKMESKEILLFKGQIWFFKVHKKEKYLPTLHFVHKFPSVLPAIYTDKMAVSFILNGADVMAPGILADLSDMNVKIGDVVVIAFYIFIYMLSNTILF